jgi:TM2 domain-containing membrane protein YozV
MKKLPVGVLTDVVSARNIVFVAMLAVGGFCIMLSASNTTAYLELTGMAHNIALMTGIALVIFSSISATAAQLFLGQNGWAKIFAVPFIIVGATVIVFSIFSTLSLNYNKFISSPAIQADMQEKIEKRKAEIIAAYQEEAAGEYDDQDVNQWAMQNLDRLLSMAESSGSSWNNSMRTIMEAAQGMAETEQRKGKTLDEVLENIYVETLPKTFFGFMLNLKSLEQKYMFDFFMIAIPAIFYDLIAPLAMTVVLFLMGFKSKKKTEDITEDGTETEAVASPPNPKEEQPDIKQLTAYIENAMQEEYKILPDDAVPNLDAEAARKCREHLSSFIYKGNPLISERDGQYVSIFDKVNLIRFITLQNNVQRITGGKHYEIPLSKCGQEENNV